MRSLSLLSLAICAGLAVGCGGSEVPAEAVDVMRFVTVINLAGEKETIPAGEIVDAATGKPRVQSVLAVDRRTGKMEMVPVEQVLRESPSTARYIPATTDLPVPPKGH